MDADIRLDGNLTTIEGDFVKTTAVDVVIDNPGRRRASGGNRRAFVHDFNDGLTLEALGHQIEVLWRRWVPGYDGPRN